jgi:hypothetical protein
MLYNSLFSSLDLFAVSCCDVELPLRLFKLQDLDPEVVVEPMTQLNTCGTCRPSWATPTGPVTFKWV